MTGLGVSWRRLFQRQKEIRNSPSRLSAFFFPIHCLGVARLLLSQWSTIDEFYIWCPVHYDSCFFNIIDIPKTKADIEKSDRHFSSPHDSTTPPPLPLFPGITRTQGIYSEADQAPAQATIGVDSNRAQQLVQASPFRHGEPIRFPPAGAIALFA